MKLLDKIGVISPNALKLFASCPGKFYYRYCEQIPIPSLDKNFITGKNIHAIASYMLKGVGIEIFENALTAYEKELWNFLKSNKYFSYDIVGIEKSISCKTGDFWIGGRLDALVKNGNDYYILDYKTGGLKENMVFDYQTMVYLCACDSLISEYDNLSFVYLDLKNKKEIKIDFTNELKNQYTDKLNNMCKKIEEFNIDNLKKCDNKKCEYFKICKN